jgi:hypothetical protein
MSWRNDSKPLRDEEYPEPDGDDESFDQTYPCPECGAAVYEDAEQCPHCFAYVSPSSSPWQGRSLVWIGLGLLGIGATLVTLLRLLP